MSDIVEQLRSAPFSPERIQVMREAAADEIERLTRERDALRAHYADEQQRLFHYERVIAEQRVEIEQLKGRLK